MSSFLAYEAEEKDCDVPEPPERRRVSSALADEAEKEEAGCSGAPAQAEKEAECRHAPEKEAECPDHSPEERRSALTRRRRRRRRRRPLRKVDELLPP